MLEVLQNNGGWMAEKQLLVETELDLSVVEQLSILRHLENTERVVRKALKVPNSTGKEVERIVVVLPGMYEKLVNDGVLKISTPRKV
jgi:hypothetical protein